MGRTRLGCQKFTSSSGARAAKKLNQSRSVFATQYFTPTVYGPILREQALAMATQSQGANGIDGLPAAARPVRMYKRTFWPWKA